MKRLAVLATALLLSSCRGDGFDYVGGVEAADWSVVPRAQAPLPAGYPTDMLGQADVLSGTAVNGSGEPHKMVGLRFVADGVGDVQVQIVALSPGERRFFAVGVPGGGEWEYVGAVDYNDVMP